MGYRERHGKGTLIPCFVIMILISGASYYILTNGLDRNSPADNDNNVETFQLKFELYSESYNVSGRLTVYNDVDEIFEVITMDDEGKGASIKEYLLGEYKVYYLGATNEVEFGPVLFNVQMPDSLLIDRDYVGIRLTVMVL